MNIKNYGGKRRAVQLIPNIHWIKERKVKENFSVPDFVFSLKKQVYKNRTVRLSSPLEIHWDITRRCNLNCIYCYTNRESPSKEELTLKEIQPIIKEISCFRGSVLTLEGGEPFLREDIFEILKYIKEQRILLDIITNGTLIDKKKAKSLRNILDIETDGLQITLDGYTAQIHNQNRPFSFEYTLRGIRELLSQGIKVNINCVITMNNYQYLPEIYEVTHNMGITQGFTLTPTFPVGKGKQIRNVPIELLLDPFDLLLKREKELQSPLIFGYFTFPYLLLEKYPSLKPLMANKKINNYMRCTAGRSKINIDANGDVYPCVFFQYPKFRLGNVKENELMEIWNSPRVKEFIRYVSEKSTKCIKCDYNDFCGGICPAFSENIPCKITSPTNEF